MLANRVRMGVQSGFDFSKLPGSNELVGGDMSAGYFGQVGFDELISRDELTSLLTITEGLTRFLPHGNWLKFAIDGKIIYRSQYAFRHSISYNHLLSKRAVFGDKVVTYEGIDYKVRLMKGLNDGESWSSDRGVVNHNSEWNRLMLPIHEKANNQSWSFPNHVNIPTENWRIGFKDADFYDNSKNGAYVLCQESYTEATHIVREYWGPSSSESRAKSLKSGINGWYPVLEAVM